MKKEIVLIFLVALLLSCSPEHFTGTVIEKHIAPGRGVLSGTDYLVIVEIDAGDKVSIDDQDAYYLFNIGDRITVYYDRFFGHWFRR